MMPDRRSLPDPGRPVRTRSAPCAGPQAGIRRRTPTRPSRRARWGRVLLAALLALGAVAGLLAPEPSALFDVEEARIRLLSAPDGESAARATAGLTDAIARLASQDRPAAETWKAREAWEAGRLLEAVSRFRQARLHAPSAGKPRLEYGLAALLLHERHGGPRKAELLSEADSVFRRLIEVDAESWEARLADVIRHTLCGEFQASLTGLASLALERPGTPEPGLLRGWILWRRGWNDAAVRELSAVAEISPGFAPARVLRLRASLAARNDGSEPHDLAALRDRWADLPEVLEADGLLRLVRNDGAGALPPLTRAAALDPGSLEAARLRATACLLLRDAAPALQALDAWIAADPADGRPVLRRAELLLGSGRAGEAERTLRLHLEEYPHSAETDRVQRLLDALAASAASSRSAVSVRVERPRR